MNARERMLAAIDHHRPDRVPTDIWAVPEVWAKLKDHFGPEADIGQALHIDGLAGVGPKYVGPPLPPTGAEESIDIWSVRRRRVDYGTGVYEEMCQNPLAEASSIDDLRRYNWPQEEWFDYSGMRAAAAAAHPNKAVMCGYMAPFTYHIYLRGLEAALTDPLTQAEFTCWLLERLGEFLCRHHRRMFQACAGLIDLTQVTDDYGMQTGPLMSPATFRRFYKPQLKRCIDLAHEFGIRVFHHDDGAIGEILPDLVQLGIDVLNPIQWRCPGMERRQLKRAYGQRLCFHGGMDNQRTVPFGSVEEVRKEVRDNIDILASDRTGYVLAPCHNLQAITPVENIIAMYDEAYRYGRT